MDIVRRAQLRIDQPTLQGLDEPPPLPPRKYFHFNFLLIDL